MSEMLDRLKRYCAALPCDEPVPIHDHEKYELAETTSLYSQSDSVRFALQCIENGTFRYRGHRVVILESHGCRKAASR